MKNIRIGWLVIFILLASCGRPVQSVPPTFTAAPVTQTSPPTDTSAPPTEPPIPLPTQDPAVFGALGTGEIQAFALESVVNAIFVRVMDGFKAGGVIQEYQVTSVTVFPGGDGLITEVIYNVQTTDPDWLADGGTQSADGWIQGNCSRFDFFTTETEYQLRNRRLCG
jgi:hypothetical protein